MSTKITTDNLEQIWRRWERYDVPERSQDKISEFVTIITGKMFDLISLAGSLDEKASFTMGEKFAEVVIHPLMLCYYIGYELSSGRMSRDDGTPYLTAATEPIEDYVLTLVKILLTKGFKNTEKLRAMAVEISRLIGDASNEICVLGIENLRRIENK